MGDGKVTFETKCWQRDWEVLLQTDYLEKMIANCNFPFSTKRLLINNVDDINAVKRYADKAVKTGLIDEYVVVDELAEKVLKKLNLTKEELGKGYYYSIAELVGIYCCSTEYLVHFSSDTCLEKKWKNNFIRDGLNLFAENENVAVVNPMWNYKWHELENPNWDKSKTFHLGGGFSDQCYMIKAEEFNRDIYHFWHETGEQYPAYGGELFEKRCNAYLRVNKRMRAVHMKSSYWTENIRGLVEYKREHAFPRNLWHRIRYKI